MSLIRQGNMIRIRGINGYGFVKEIIYASQSLKTVFSVELIQRGEIKANEMVLLDPEDCELYRADSTKHARIYAHPDDHYHAALMMREAA